MADELTIKVVSSTSESLLVSLDLASASVLSLKQLIEQQDAHRFPVAAQRLIFQGQILQDAKSLTEYHVTTGCALHLTLSPNGTATAAAVATFAPHSQLMTFLQQMRDSESSDAYALAVQTLQKICINIVDHPSEDKYRKLRVGNAALKAKLFDRTRGRDSVHLLGFQDGVLAVGRKNENSVEREREQELIFISCCVLFSCCCRDTWCLCRRQRSGRT